MNYFFKQFLVLVTLFLSLQLTAQTELKSKIVDFATYAPIENASIYIENSTIGTVSNSDGKFVLVVPQRYVSDTLVISSIGYKSFRSAVADFDVSMDVFLEEDMASLDEVILIAETRPKTGNDIVLRAIEELPDNLPEQPYLQKGFLRHKERNTTEYKWLIESAITLYDSSYASGAKKNLKINVDETRKSYDLRDVDSLYAYTAYLKNKTNADKALRSKNLRRDTIKTETLVEAIKWNDERVNGLDKLFRGKLNIFRNANASKALFGDDVLEHHQFRLDTVLVENGKKLYKIEIKKGADFVGLNTPGIYNEGFEPRGWLYIDWDTYAIKKMEYELVAASQNQKNRSKSLFGTLLNHKVVMTYISFEDKMYPKYIYYETPKLVNAGDRSSDQLDKKGRPTQDKNDFYYNTVQEIVFTEVVQDPEIVSESLQQNWSEDIFVTQPYNETFWENYNVLLESEEEEKLIQDLSKRASLFKQ
ncbi:carboxypeptidase-like regulatory domain-containing protein [Cochleicola gelatinilyticus]|uniref:Carboxypeptidase-like regulatory domain-containing protein n=1 Tax=Cochleicola gelatinilyticus TaxID=1763537 RepID=A0A167KDJ5_9FLAO|nr:carboxypeptidase-like regulatory domain-containing protein [Cochleicola gelatinilyticus]OAB81779.1 hypothetical protein ULVI_00105 [Cochleicola gelatinilyticus]